MRCANTSNNETIQSMKPTEIISLTNKVHTKIRELNFNLGKSKQISKGGHVPIAGSISHQDIVDLANTIGVKNPRALEAIAQQETKGEPFYKPGQAKILFERHYMYKILKDMKYNVNKLHKQYPDLVNPNGGGYGKYSAQYLKLSDAKKINESAAIQSASWGRFQVMGKWYAYRYNSAKELETAMNFSEKEQLLYFAAYLQNTPGMIDALNSEKWEEVATLYNGAKWRTKNPDYAKNLRTFFEAK